MSTSLDDRSDLPPPPGLFDLGMVDEQEAGVEPIAGGLDDAEAERRWWNRAPKADPSAPVPPLTPRAKLFQGVLVLVFILSVSLLVDLLFVSSLQQRAAQQRLFDDFREQLAEGTALAGVFTRNVCCSSEVELGREAVAVGRARALVVNMVDQRVLKPTPEFMTYALAKAALWALTRTAAQALAPDIRVNAIGPGPTMQGARQSVQHFARQRVATILQRGAGAGDITAALGYLIDAPGVTGQLLLVDGGQHLAWQTPDILGLD